MKTLAAVVVEPGKPIEIEELTLAKPGPHEVLIQYQYGGLCHSDVHIAIGDTIARLPMVLGHEGAGIIQEVGPGVTRVKPGDHVICSFTPACGRCKYCATGRQSVCDMNAAMLEGHLEGPRWPISGPRGQYGAMCTLGTFSQYNVINEYSVVKVDDDIPLDKAVLVGCGVPTGWGSAVYAADTKPGDIVVIFGIGGIGINAVQGAKHAGAEHIIVIDPLQNKRDKAIELGATQAFDNAADAKLAVDELTNGQGAESAIITTDLITAEQVSAGFSMIGRCGTLVLTALNRIDEITVKVPSTEMSYFRKTIKGSLFGDCNPTYDIPKLVRMYADGKLKLDELVTREYSLEQVNEGYDDLLAGKNIRGIIKHQH
ncbi:MULTISPECIES: NDMA-dependent alcohol dehydrogenase [Gordonia]|uniref:alcohol dehydrogenase n=2 Tax=Gordonia TaxID=2053 RepID=L7LKW2_9ACTN|nr:MULTISPECIES: NDMA-dependent alcohol dehydrogenase [Gordonia]AUH67485.1 NDMA-dependent alcohol dehydrogenase [Gordonia sp. YC-JH1]KJR07155.1 alcohol dehydrogenase [Gordonia sihwensis]KXT57008.1 alcohol dehydrogenase [Gordonia sp. QH-12]MBY4568511.1 alcohol dehydrogenase [Gordonia sihwensis]WFN92852.1 NDMA-dependent alcohol dehydrogenase [Gordonia sihwensis]